MDATLLHDPAPREAGLVSLDGRPYPLELAKVEARAEGGLSLTTLRQHFANPYAEALEVAYTLPLPADGAVLGYVIHAGDLRIVGEVRSRDAAAAAYRKALYEGHTAGLLEEDRADTFHQRLGNIPGETPVEVEIHVLHPLGFRAGEGAPAPEWEYRFPTTVGVRYMGEPGRVTDAGRLSPSRSSDGLPARFTLDLVVGDEVPGMTIRSPSHSIRCTCEQEALRATFTEPARLDRDVVARWPAAAGAAAGIEARASTDPGPPDGTELRAPPSTDPDPPDGTDLRAPANTDPGPPDGTDVHVRMVEGAGLDGDDGRYGLLTVTPPARPSAVFQRDLTLLLDASGSMHGLPLALAKRVIRAVLRDLDAGDRFEIQAFSTSVRSLTGGLVEADSQSIRAALAQLERLRASGGTEMRSAIEAALESLRTDAQRQVILVTDGYIGFEGEVIAAATRGLPPGVRIHAVGVGAAPNRTLTRGLTRAGRGSELFASDEETADEAARILRNATARPVLTELEVGGNAIRTAAPARPLDVLAGHPTLLTVELAPEGGRLELAGRLSGRPKPWRWSCEVSAARDAGVPRTPLPLGALHGREVVADLELEAAAGEGRRAIDDRIEACALRHRIVSRRTSLVAVAEHPSVDPTKPRRRERLAVELPAGVSAEGAGLARGRPAARPSDVLSPMRVSEDPGILVEYDALPRPGDHDLEDGEDSVLDGEWVARSRRPERRASSKRLDAEGRLPARERTRGPGPVEVAAEVLHDAPGLLVVEIEVPSDGFGLPTDTVHIVLDDGRVVEAEVDRSGSTEPGPHPAGVRVRLALRLSGTSPSFHGRVRIRWQEGGA